MYFFSRKNTTTPVVGFADAPAGAHGFSWADAVNGISTDPCDSEGQSTVHFRLTGEFSMGSSPGWLTAFHDGRRADCAVRAVAIMLRGMVIAPPWIINAG